MSNPHYQKLIEHLEHEAIAFMQWSSDILESHKTAERIGMTTDEYRNFVVQILFCRNRQEKSSIIQQYINLEISYLLIQGNIEASNQAYKAIERIQKNAS